MPTSPAPTPEQEAFNAFIKEYGELVAKHKMDFVAFPVFQPTDAGKWEITVQTQAVSTKDKPVKSPFVAQA